MKQSTFAFTTAAAGVLFCSAFLGPARGAAAFTNQPASCLMSRGAPLHWAEIGAKAGADYHGDGLSVAPAGQGARLRCAFQRLEGEATAEGLWLVSIVTNAASERFRVVASSIGRLPQKATKATKSLLPLFASVSTERQKDCRTPRRYHAPRHRHSAIAHRLVRFLRPGLTEEYSVSGMACGRIWCSQSALQALARCRCNWRSPERGSSRAAHPFRVHPPALRRRKLWCWC